MIKISSFTFLEKWLIENRICEQVRKREDGRFNGLSFI